MNYHDQEVWKDIVGYEGSYQISNYGNVIISLYNILGEKVIEIINNRMLKGTYHSEVNLSKLQPGVYNCIMIRNGENIAVKRLVISKG